MENVSVEKLQKQWIHSHEEDTAGEMIFRPATFPFPRSRGRMGFELKPGNVLVETGIAPADGPKISQGKWDLNDKNELTLSSGAGASSSRVMHILSASDDRLVIRK